MTNKMRWTFVTQLLAATVLWAGMALGEGDAEKGEKEFRKCKSCHAVGADAKNKVGPVLNDIIGAPIAANANFKYSKVLQELGEAGELWTNENLDAFLTKPKAFAKGTKMSFGGLKKPEARANVIAYLATFSTQGELEAVEDTGFAVSPEILALEGDAEYGEYLSSECTTCHQADGANDGIPGIVGWPKADFVTAMHAYKEKHRENPVMQMTAGRLSNDEIAALAVYFESLGN